MAVRHVGREGGLERALDAILRKVRRAKVVQVGFMENAVYPDGTPVALAAAVNNYGAPAAGVPPRPFFSNLVADKKEDWGHALGENLKATDYDAEKALALLGQGIEGDLRKAINDFVGVPLKPRTIKRKGFDKQLIDTADMINSVSSRVK